MWRRGWRRLRREFGPESVLPYSYAGTIGQLGYGSMDRRFFHRLGASQLDRTICCDGGRGGAEEVYGVKLGTPPEDFAHAGLVIAWGANIHGNNVHLWPFIEEARRKGARLVVIDPYRTRTAALADEHLAINPGTDTALALGMMHVILREGLEDREYVERVHDGVCGAAGACAEAGACAGAGGEGDGDCGRGDGAAGAGVCGGVEADGQAGGDPAELRDTAERQRRDGGAGGVHAAAC